MEWKEITTAPNETKILVYGKNGMGNVLMETAKFIGGNWVSCGKSFAICLENTYMRHAELLDYKITHWMPLPEPPKDTRKERPCR